MGAPVSQAWFDRITATPVAEVARALGHRAESPGRRGIYDCPACGAHTRHTKSRDKRGAVGVERDDAPGWRCFQCDASGDALDFIAFKLCGVRYRQLASVQRSEVDAWAARFLGMDIEERTEAPQRRRRPRRAHRGASRGPAKRSAQRSATTGPGEQAAGPPPKYPDRAEIVRWWATCPPVGEDPEVVAWLREQGIDPVAIQDLDAARAISPAPAPWAHFGQTPWAQLGMRLVVPLRDATGAIRSVLARRTIGQGKKSLAATGYQRTGLVMACPMAVQVLEAGRPDWWPAHGAPPLDVWVMEGEKDFLFQVAGRTSAERWSDADGFAPMALGMVQGAWSQALADRIPDGARVFAATDSDSGGDKYADAIEATLAQRIDAGRMEMHRWRPMK